MVSAWKYWPFWLSVLILDQKSGFSRTPNGVWLSLSTHYTLHIDAFCTLSLYIFILFIKLSAILVISFGIGPKPKKWFQSYTTWCLAFPKYTLHNAHWFILYIISIHFLLFMNELLNLLGNLQIHHKPLKYSVPKRKSFCLWKKGTSDNVRLVLERLYSAMMLYVFS